jgi:hypothetical protein
VWEEGRKGGSNDARLYTSLGGGGSEQINIIYFLSERKRKQTYKRQKGILLDVIDNDMRSPLSNK